MTSPTDDRADHEANLPGVRVNDEDREAAIDRIQQAMVDGYVEFDELDDRFGLVYAAGTRADLDRATAGIPAEVVAHPIVGHPTPSTAISLIGDLIRGGWMAVSGRLRAIAIIGSVKIDLTTAEIPHDGVVIDVYSLIGDVQILVPDGARVESHGISVIAGTRMDLSRPMPYGDTITIRAYSLIGDVRVTSLSRISDKRLRKLWKQLRS